MLQDRGLSCKFYYGNELKCILYAKIVCRKNLFSKEGISIEQNKDIFKKKYHKLPTPSVTIHERLTKCSFTFIEYMNTKIQCEKQHK